MLKRILCLALVAAVRVAADTPITPVPPHADFRVASIQVRIAPDHRDWTYKPGEPAKFRIMVTADNTPVDNATVTWSVGPEMMPAEKKTALVPLDGLVVDGGTLNTGGFIRCKASVEFAGRTYNGVATAAFAPETIKPFQTEPADFDAFWAKGKEDVSLRFVNADDPKLTLARLALVDAVRQVILNALAILGVSAPEELS